jgi:hypothetical protein
MSLSAILPGAEGELTFGCCAPSFLNLGMIDESDRGESVRCWRARRPDSSTYSNRRELIRVGNRELNALNDEMFRFDVEARMVTLLITYCETVLADIIMPSLRSIATSSPHLFNTEYRCSGTFNGEIPMVRR